VFLYIITDTERVRIVNRTKKKRKAGKKIRRIPLHELYSRDNGICCLCGTPVSMLEATREHKKARSRGGKDGKNYSNIGLAHKSCNVRKGSDIWHFSTR
jgi:5-methylcytosine-specific restriction endonuclease McrA